MMYFISSEKHTIPIVRKINLFNAEIATEDIWELAYDVVSVEPELNDIDGAIFEITGGEAESVEELNLNQDEFNEAVRITKQTIDNPDGMVDYVIQKNIPTLLYSIAVSTHNQETVDKLLSIESSAVKEGLENNDEVINGKVVILETQKQQKQEKINQAMEVVLSVGPMLEQAEDLILEDLLPFFMESEEIIPELRDALWKIGNIGKEIYAILDSYLIKKTKERR